MKYINKRRNRRHTYGNLLFLVGSILFGAAIQWLYTPNEPVSPLGKAVEVAEARDVQSPSPIVAEVKVAETIEPDDIQKTDEWVAKYVDKYCKGHYCRSRMRGIMHCLLTKESEHTFMTASDHHGDNGMAGGILQYWPDTWTGFRKIMINKGLITEIGSRYNPEQAIETTVWAILDNREGNWGPVNRGECLSAKGAK